MLPESTVGKDRSPADRPRDASVSGKELAGQLKTFRPDVRILFTSGYTDDGIVHHCVFDPECTF